MNRFNVKPALPARLPASGLQPVHTSLSIILACLMWRGGPVAADPMLRFSDATPHSGVRFEHYDGSSGEKYIVEYISSGMASFDYDGDGLLDLYFLNGAKLRGSEFQGNPVNRLYRNLGGFRFRDVTDAAGVADDGHGLGVAAADIDNDGDQDLYVNNFGPNVLYLNQGDGTFSRYTGESDLSCGGRVGAGVCFLDVEADGDLDLFVANYVDFGYDNHVEHIYRGVKTYAGPKDYRPQMDALFRNNGDGSWTDISRTSGIAAVGGTGMGTVATDFDRDGDPDIFVCNDVMANFLYQNDGAGHFTERGILAGVAYDYLGTRQGSMGVDCGDVDGDGNLDLVMSNFEDETPVVYRNSELGFFEDVTIRTGDVVDATPHVTWGVGLADFDLDTDLDLFIASGHLMKSVARVEDTQSYEARNLLLQNDGTGRFRNLTRRAGSGLEPERVSRGASVADLDCDGDLDIVVLNSNAAPTLARNDTNTEAHWLEVRLVGLSCNRDGVGARVTATVGDRRVTREVHSGRGYQSHHGMRLHFGLGAATRVDALDVEWPGGGTEHCGVVPRDRLVLVVQGSGAANSAHAPTSD